MPLNNKQESKSPMQKLYLLLALMFITSCSNQQSADSVTAIKTANASNQKAISWIENNLSPLHALQGHANRKSINQLMLEDDIPGLSMAFVDNANIVWTKSYGVSNLATSEKVTAQTVFTGASLSKPLTAMAALNLVDAGKLKLDEDVNQTLLDWKVPQGPLTAQEKVTLRRLITHQAGIKNDLWSSYLPSDQIPTLTQQLAGLAPSVDPATSVITVPGSTERYSNPGYSIIQKLLKDVTSQSFDNILDTLVLQPSGMNDSSFAQPMPTALQQRRAIGYDENLQPYPYRLFPYKAAGGVWTTPTDMAKFVITLFEDYQGKAQILSPSMATEVFSRNRERLGFSKIFNDTSEDLVFRHYGSNQGFTSYLIGSLQRKQAVVIMINSDNGFALLDYIARAVAQYYQWDYLKPNIYQVYADKTLDLKEYQGNFSGDGQTVKFNFEQNNLWLTSNKDEKPLKLVAVSKSAFIDTTDSTKYQFYSPRGKPEEDAKWVHVIKPSGNDYWAEKTVSKSEPD